MGFVNSARGQIVGVIPNSTEPPAAHTHMKNITDQVEARLVLRLTAIGADSTITPVQTGMLVTTTSTPWEVYLRSGLSGGTWKKVWPQIFYGTAAPTASVPANTADGDIYIQYT